MTGSRLIRSGSFRLAVPCGIGMGGKVHELALLDQVSQALAEARSFEQIKDIRDKAEAVRKYAQSASLGLGIQNRAAEVKLRAERQAGKLLAQMALRGGDRRSKTHRERLKLDDLGITRNQSTRWQIQARVPEEVFREHIQQTCAAGKELTSARLMRLAKQWHEAKTINGHVNGRNGHAASRNGASHKGGETFDGDHAAAHPLTEMIDELTNHHQLLESVLRPVYSGDSASLAPAERRVLRYLLVEIQKVLGRLDKWQQRGARCTCTDKQNDW